MFFKNFEIAKDVVTTAIEVEAGVRDLDKARHGDIGAMVRTTKRVYDAVDNHGDQISPRSLAEVGKRASQLFTEENLQLSAKQIQNALTKGTDLDSFHMYELLGYATATDFVTT